MPAYYYYSLLPEILIDSNCAPQGYDDKSRKKQQVSSREISSRMSWTEVSQYFPNPDICRAPAGGNSNSRLASNARDKK